MTFVIAGLSTQLPHILVLSKPSQSELMDSVHRHPASAAKNGAE